MVHVVCPCQHFFRALHPLLLPLPRVRSYKKGIHIRIGNLRKNFDYESNVFLHIEIHRVMSYKCAIYLTVIECSTKNDENDENDENELRLYEGENAHE